MDQALTTVASIALSKQKGGRLHQRDTNRGAIGMKPNGKLDWHLARTVNRRATINRRVAMTMDKDVKAYSAI